MDPISQLPSPPPPSLLPPHRIPGSYPLLSIRSIELALWCQCLGVEGGEGETTMEQTQELLMLEAIGVLNTTCGGGSSGSSGGGGGKGGEGGGSPSRLECGQWQSQANNMVHYHHYYYYYYYYYYYCCCCYCYCYCCHCYYHYYY